jgi:mono/diheme cytochrome c family protein
MERRKQMKNRNPNTGAMWFFMLILALAVAPVMCAQGSAEATYKAKCAGCHGADGAGSTPAGKALAVHDFQSPDVQKESDAELADIISKGKNKMPKYGDKLKGSEISDLVVYVRTLGKKK